MNSEQFNDRAHAEPMQESIPEGCTFSPSFKSTELFGMAVGSGRRSLVHFYSSIVKPTSLYF